MIRVPTVAACSTVAEQYYTTAQHAEQTPNYLRLQGYVAEKVTILLGALRSALRRVGLVVQTVDDSLLPLEDKLKEPAVQVRAE